MSNIKKIIGIVLALVMVLSMASVAFAAEEPAYSIRFEVVDDVTEIEPGDATGTTIKVHLTTNFYASAISIPIFFDGTNVDVVAVAADDIKDNSNIATENSADVAKFYESVEHTPETSALRALVYIAPYLSEIKMYNDDVVMTLTVTAKDDAVSDNVVFDCVEDAIKTSTHPSGALYVSMNPIPEGSEDEWKQDPKCDAIPVVVDNATIEEATATIKVVGVGGDPELVLSEKGVSSGAVIDKVSYCSDGNGFIYGIDTDLGESIEDYITTEYGSIEVVPNDLGVISTGAKILLKNDAGEVVETYYFVFFGDVNGDGYVDNTDVSMMDAVANYMDFSFDGSDGTAVGLAADANGDGWLDNTDVSVVDAVANYMEFPTQADYAATVAAARGAV